MSDKTGLDLLRVPFKAEQISKLPKPTISNDEWRKLPKAVCNECGGYHPTTKTIHLDYVGHAALTARLLDADPSWNWEPVSWDQRGQPVLDENGGMWIRLTVCGVTRLGYGDAQGKVGGNAVKERIGDALRNAAMRFGAALDMWSKADLHADVPEPIKPGERKDNGTIQGPGANTPTTGVWEALPIDEKAFLQQEADNVTTRLAFDPMDGAKYLAGLNLDNDEMIAIWTRFDSKQRAALKKAEATIDAEAA